jgi:DNA modification methylase
MIYHETPSGTLHQGEVLDILRTLPDESVNCCVTSPPYWGLRDYGTAEWVGGSAECDHIEKAVSTTYKASKEKQQEMATKQFGGQYKDTCAKCGAIRKDQQLGLEKTPEDYVARMVEIFREVRRVLRKDGTLWLNLGDSYNSHSCGKGNVGGIEGNRKNKQDNTANTHRGNLGLKDKDLVGIPWRVAFALQADGWWLRQDIIWCLSGGTYLYVKSQKGEMPMTVKDMARLDPSTVKLWNGEKWTQLLGTSKSKRKGDEIELVLRSGERISCTQNHRFETQNGLTEARNIRVGDVLTSCRLPEPAEPRETALTMAAWLCGLYIAEGSKSGDTIQISGHAKETSRLELLTKIAHRFGGHITHTIDGNNMSIRLYGKVLCAIIDEFVSGKTAKDKCFSTSVWQYSNFFIRTMMLGYLRGDGHMDLINHRWRLGFTRNYNLERDLRTACARIGWQITLNPSTTKYNGRIFPTFRGEIRYKKSDHRNSKNRNEVVEIRKARCRYVYDIGVADEPHLFALASGILTHNSKPNPMPESVTDRCTKAHEYVFLMSKSAKYYYDSEAIKENKGTITTRKASELSIVNSGVLSTPGIHGGFRRDITVDGRNRRSVWTVTTKPFKEAHFATFPRDLIRPMIQAGCPAGGVVLDPFMGSGTTAIEAIYQGKRYIGIDLNPDYCAMAAKRIDAELEQTVIDFP